MNNTPITNNPNQIPELPVLKQGCVGVSPFNLYQPVPSDFGENISYIECLLGLVKQLNRQNLTINQVIDKINSLDPAKSGVLAFDNVNEMKSSSALGDGSYAFCAGRNSFNDGLAFVYKIQTITNQVTMDGFTTIPLDNPNLYAQVILENGKIDVQKFGATPSNTDCYAILQNLINNYPHRTLYFKEGTYNISQPLIIKAGNDYQVNLEFDNAILRATQPIVTLISVGSTIGGAYNRYAPGSIIRITGATLDASNCQSAIMIGANQKGTIVKDLTIYNIGQNVGITLLKEGNGSNDCLIDNASINGIGSDVGGIGINALGFDSKILNSRVNKCQTGIVDNGNYYSNIHLLTSYQAQTPSSTALEDIVGMKLIGSNCNLNQVYFDTCTTSILIASTTELVMENCQQYQWYTDNSVQFKTFQIPSNLGGARIRCNNMSIKHQSNYIGVATDSNLLNYNSVYPTFQFSNIIESSPINEPLPDILHNRILYLENQFTTIDPWSKVMTAEQYYPIALVNNAQHSFDLSMNNDQLVHVKINNATLDITNIANNAHSNQYQLALIKGPKISNIYYNYLCVKSSASDCNYCPTIFNAGGFNSQIYTYRGIGNYKIDNPQILATASFNP